MKDEKQSHRGAQLQPTFANYQTAGMLRPQSPQLPAQTQSLPQPPFAPQIPVGPIGPIDLGQFGGAPFVMPPFNAFQQPVATPQQAIPQQAILQAGAALPMSSDAGRAALVNAVLRAAGGKPGMVQRSKV